MSPYERWSPCLPRSSCQWQAGNIEKIETSASASNKELSEGVFIKLMIAHRSKERAQQRFLWRGANDFGATLGWKRLSFWSSWWTINRNTIPMTFSIYSIKSFQHKINICIQICCHRILQLQGKDCSRNSEELHPSQKSNQKSNHLQRFKHKNAYLS